MREVKLGSGAILKINDIPFSEAKALYKAALKELKGIQFSSKTETAALFKDIVCHAFSSEEVEEKLNVCLARCQYNNLRIDQSTFEPEKARGDYTQVCTEVMKDSISPFLTNLSAVYLTLFSAINKSHA